jgi:hypothetical protein
MALSQKQKERHLEIYNFYKKQTGSTFSDNWISTTKKYGTALNTLKNIIKRIENV